METSKPSTRRRRRASPARIVPATDESRKSGEEEEEEDEESDDDSVSDLDPAAKKARYTDKLNTLKKELEAVKKGTDSKTKSILLEFEVERNRKLKTAELHKTLQMKNNNDMYQFALQRSKDLQENEKLEGKKKLLEPLYKRLKMTQEKKPNVPKHKQQVQVPSRIGKDSTLLSEQSWRSKYEEFVDKMDEYKLNQLENVKYLSFDESLADVKKIYAQWQNCVTKTTSCQDAVEVRKGALHQGTNKYMVNDKVSVSSKLSNESYVGNILSITDEQLETGMTAKVPISYLQSARCGLEPYKVTERQIDRLKDTGFIF